MDKFTKITVGFVTQTFDKNENGRFVCTHQQFVAGDQCDYEDVEGNPIEPPDHQYQSYNMTLCTNTREMTEAITKNRIYEAIEQVLQSLDVGGEQSRQFGEEIKLLRDALKVKSTVDDRCPKCRASFEEREFVSKDYIEFEAVHMHYTCNKCGNRITEEFTLTDVFIDNSR